MWWYERSLKIQRYLPKWNCLSNSRIKWRVGILCWVYVVTIKKYCWFPFWSRNRNNYNYPAITHRLTMKSTNKMLCLVNLPNGTTFGIQCDPKAIGQKCLEEVSHVHIYAWIFVYLFTCYNPMKVKHPNYVEFCMQSHRKYYILYTKKYAHEHKIIFQHLSIFWLHPKNGHLHRFIWQSA